MREANADVSGYRGVCGRAGARVRLHLHLGNRDFPLLPATRFKTASFQYLLSLAAAVLLLPLLGACGHDNSTQNLGGGTTTTTPVAAQVASCATGTANVIMQNEAFIPASITVPVNSNVKWTNTDTTGNNYWIIIGSFESPRVGPGQSVCLEFTAPGTYQYHCDPLVRGTVVVEPAPK